MALTDREREVLDLERNWWFSAPTKQQAIAERLGCSPATYYAALRRLAPSADAFAYDPLVVQRLRKRAVNRRRIRVTGSAQLDRRP